MRMYRETTILAGREIFPTRELWTWKIHLSSRTIHKHKLRNIWKSSLEPGPRESFYATMDDPLLSKGVI